MENNNQNEKIEIDYKSRIIKQLEQIDDQWLLWQIWRMIRNTSGIE